MNNKNIAKIIASMKDKYAQEGIDIIGIFGSYSRQEDNKYSDIDIVYDLNRIAFDERYKSGFAKLIRLKEIGQELEAMLHKKVDLIQLGTTNQRLSKEIKRDMIYV